MRTGRSGRWDALLMHFVFIISALATAAFTLVLMKRNIQDLSNPSRNGEIHDRARWMLLSLEVMNLVVCAYTMVHALTEII